MTYVQQPWVDDVTEADAEHMNHIEAGIAAADAAGLPPPVSGKWLAAIGGVAVWQDLPSSPSGAGAIPGEIKMWSGASLPSGFGNWVWADGIAYDVGTYPVAAVNIASGWRTHAGKPDPGAGFFRVPDLRGATPAGMDAMPGGVRANRVTRAAALTLAGVTGEEYHVLSQAESASHGHGVNEGGGHAHSVYDPPHSHLFPNVLFGEGSDDTGPNALNSSHRFSGTNGSATGVGIYPAGTGISIAANGGGGAHENLPPMTFVPYIVKLDG